MGGKAMQIYKDKYFVKMFFLFLLSARVYQSAWSLEKFVNYNDKNMEINISYLDTCYMLFEL